MVNSQDDLRSLATLQRPSALRFVLQPPPPCAHVSFQQANVASYCPDSTLSVSDAPYSTSSYAKFTQVRSLISNRAQHDDTGTYSTGLVQKFVGRLPKLGQLYQTLGQSHRCAKG